MYLQQILGKYSAVNLTRYELVITQLWQNLIAWAGNCYIKIIPSGSRAKGTAISLASDVDYLISLTNNCNANNDGLRGIYNSLFNTINQKYQNVRKQNVSVRINLDGLEVDITPARIHIGNTNDHSLYMSKQDTWKQTNIQRHITDVSQSNRLNEIKLLKIWRELNNLDFPSIYLEYLLIDSILSNKQSGLVNLENNFYHVLQELAKDSSNPLDESVTDPANSSNVLSDLLDDVEKEKIISQAKSDSVKQEWNEIFQ